LHILEGDLLFCGVADLKSIACSLTITLMPFATPAVPFPNSDSAHTVLIPATFMQRLTAGLIDFALTAAVILALGRICSNSQALAKWIVIPLALWSFAYPAVAHAFYGCTVGKFVLKVRVVRLDGRPIGWGESLRRSSIDGLAGAIWLAGLMIGILHLPASAFHDQGWAALYKSIAPLFPTSVRTIVEYWGLWGWSEFVTMLTTRDRRAIHDFIGSTRVIRIVNSKTTTNP
jgi:uncharacterized RDD family membrane protein YckC